MSKNPNLKSLENLFEKGKDFELTDAQYEKKTGAALPKRKSYLLYDSALARKANEYDYYLEAIERTITITKIMGVKLCKKKY